MTINTLSFHRLRNILLSLLLVSGGANCARAAGTASISGQVTSAGTSPACPVAGVQVTFVGRHSVETATTDASGHYSFSGLSSGEFGAVLQTRHLLHFDCNEGVTVPPGNTLNFPVTPRLTLTPLCSTDPSASRAWSIHNPLSVPVQYTWLLVGPGNKTGSGIAAPGDSTFETPAVAGLNRVQILVNHVVVDDEVNCGQLCPSGSLAGHVTDNNGAPLGNVQIAIVDASGNTVTTVYSKAHGSYSDANLPVGVYSLTYSETGYVSQTVTGIVVKSHTKTEVPTVQLTPIAPPALATVNVSVVESDTDAGISGVTVLISYSNGTNVSATTDGNGLAQFTSQPTGVAATITVTANDGSGRTSGVSSAGFASGPNAVSVSLAPIQQGSISGVVTDNNNTPLGGVVISVLDVNSNVVASGTSPATGTYSIGGIPAGTYSLAFSLPGYVPASLSGVVVNPGANVVENIALSPVAPPPSATVAVTVTDSGTGLPVVNATVQITYADNTTASGNTDGSGNVSFPGQPIGLAATILVSDNDGSGRTSTQSFSGGFSAGANSVSISIAALPSGSVVGTVTDAASTSPLPGVLVEVLDATNGVVASGTTLPDGTYDIGNVPAGTYSVTFALTNYATTNFPDVVVVSGGSVEEDAALTTTSATVVVQVVDNMGNPVPDASVTITYADNSVAGPLTTDDNGYVTFTGQPVGESGEVDADWSDQYGDTFTAGYDFSGFTVGVNSILDQQFFGD